MANEKNNNLQKYLEMQRKVEEVTQILEDHRWEEYNVKMAFD